MYYVVLKKVIIEYNLFYLKRYLQIFRLKTNSNFEKTNWGFNITMFTKCLPVPHIQTHRTLVKSNHSDSNIF